MASDELLVIEPDTFIVQNQSDDRVNMAKEDHEEFIGPYLLNDNTDVLEENDIKHKLYSVVSVYFSLWKTAFNYYQAAALNLSDITQEYVLIKNISNAIRDYFDSICNDSDGSLEKQNRIMALIDDWLSIDLDEKLSFYQYELIKTYDFVLRAIPYLTFSTETKKAEFIAKRLLLAENILIKNQEDESIHPEFPRVIQRNLKKLEYWSLSLDGDENQSLLVNEELASIKTAFNQEGLFSFTDKAASHASEINGLAVALFRFNLNQDLDGGGDPINHCEQRFKDYRETLSHWEKQVLMLIKNIECFANTIEEADLSITMHAKNSALCALGKVIESMANHVGLSDEIGKKDTLSEKITDFKAEFQTKITNCHQKLDLDKEFLCLSFWFSAAYDSLNENRSLWSLTCISHYLCCLFSNTYYNRVQQIDTIHQQIEEGNASYQLLNGAKEALKSEDKNMPYLAKATMKGHFVNTKYNYFVDWKDSNKTEEPSSTTHGPVGLDIG